MEGSDCRLKSVYVSALFAPCSSVRQILPFMSICDVVIILTPHLWCGCASWGVCINVSKLMKQKGCTLEEHILFQPQERPDFTFVNPLS